MALPLLRSRPGIESITIGLDDNRTIFLPGQRIEGHVAFSLAAATTIRLLRVRFSGTVTTHVSKSDHGSGSTVAIIFKELLTLAGSTDISSAPTIIPPGDHLHPFTFRVPLAALPASFDGKFGKISYELTALIVRPAKPLTQTTLAITIPSTVDASADRFALLQPSAKGHVHSGFWMWRNGRVEVEVSLPRGAYSSEEVVPVTVNVVNHSKGGCSIVDLCLSQSVLYKIGEETRGPSVEKIHRLTLNDTHPSTTRHILRTIHLPIPPTSTISPSIRTSILEVTHSIAVRIRSCSRDGRMHGRSSVVEVPVTIAGFPGTGEAQGQLGGMRASLESLPRYFTGVSVGRRSTSSAVAGMNDSPMSAPGRLVSDEGDEDVPLDVSALDALQREELPPVPQVPHAFASGGIASGGAFEDGEKNLVPAVTEGTHDGLELEGVMTDSAVMLAEDNCAKTAVAE